MYLYGASGHGKVIIEILENSGINIDGLYDDNPEITNLCGYQCCLFNRNLHTNNQIIISIGDNKTRKKIAEKIGKHSFGLAIDIRSSVSRRAKIGEGTVIMPGVSINSETIIGKHVIINTNASVDHDCILSDFVHISPGSSISGGAIIGEGTHIGTGASILQNIKIGKWSIIVAGSVKIRDVPDSSVVVGNPGKVIKNNINSY